MGPALLAGNTIVIKSHEGTPLSALEIAQLSTQVGFPAGRHQCGERHRRGTRRGAGASHPIPRLITLTGSVRAGKEIFRSAADDLKILRLELGGKAPFIVAEDADIGAAVKAAVASRFENCGQICICNERMYVHERIADEFIEKFVRAVKALQGRRSHDHGRCRPEVQRRRARQGRAHGRGGDGGRRRDPDRRPAPDGRRVLPRPLVSSRRS